MIRVLYWVYKAAMTRVSCFLRGMANVTHMLPTWAMYPRSGLLALF